MKEPTRLFILSIILLCGIVFGIYLKPHNSALPNPPTPEYYSPFYILSFNLKSDRDWESRKWGVMSLLETYSPDLISLQSLSSSQFQFIKLQFSSSRYRSYGDFKKEEETEISPVLYNPSRFKVSNSGSFSSSEKAGARKNCNYAELEDLTNNHKIYLFNVQLNRGQDKLASLAVVNNKMKEITKSKYPVFVTGDVCVSPGQGNPLWEWMVDCRYSSKHGFNGPILKYQNRWALEDSLQNCIFLSKFPYSAEKLNLMVIKHDTLTMGYSYNNQSNPSNYYPITISSKFITHEQLTMFD